ncbi:HlyD family efflux transporter periplasmic adaptor subunit [Sandaracinobacteroides saxicola]|uniref:HlyD family efflux transporter periplasmic adaptor subunit n=1 Tax=Sandaracinobacteroides saxicola TaxID=2759707 RepID=A0A7G5IJT6_9SPHN|nr:HlyD family efflux transporter periplasmic adaptor subunit [Sandaracinobacteroides saxicola]QMW23628.1 HlyD family efflux transporter periplasmic adaptor subunit [Sandaracinobacteroides saxicola]
MSFVRDAAAKLAVAEDNALPRTQELAKTARREGLQGLTSPVDGAVQLSVHTVGGVVQPAKRLMTVVPERGGLHVEARMLNKDAGFVREDQPVRIKVNAFLFMRFVPLPPRERSERRVGKSKATRSVSDRPNDAGWGARAIRKRHDVSEPFQ